MKKNLGFTLIELLSVIVILAIILLIATPIVLNVIKDARIGAFKVSAGYIVKTAELTYTKEMLKNNQNQRLEFYYEKEDGKTVIRSNKANVLLEHSGEKPDSGHVIISSNGKVEIALYNEKNKLCARKAFTEEEIKIEEKIEKEECVGEVSGPEVSLIGDNPLELEIDFEEEYILGENDYTAYTSLGELTTNVKIYVDNIETNIIDRSVLKEYEVIYKVIEEDMFKEEIRIVKIVDKTPPVITSVVSGANNITENSFTITRSGDAEDIHSGLATNPYIYQTSTDESTWTTKCTNNDITCEVTGLTPDTTYNYRICAADKSGNQNCIESKIINTYGMFADYRDGKTYKTVQIGDQMWFAEDLQYTGNGCLSNSWDATAPHNACRSNDSTEYPSVHYQWGAAMNDSTTEGSQGLCPTGWKIPTDNDWKALEMYIGMTQVQADAIDWRGTNQGIKLKDNVLWNGNNILGFTGLPVGFRDTDGTLAYVGSYGFWWTSTPSGTNAWRHGLNGNNGTMGHSAGNIAHGISVRCMKNLNEGTVTDARDGKTYKTIKIGEQKWFAEDLQYTGNGCLSNSWDTAAPHNACRSNGSSTYPSVHYQWGAAMNGSAEEGAQGLCPTGWKIPTDNDWKALEMYLGMTQAQADGASWRGTNQGLKLKTSIWGGNNVSGFTALPVGSRGTDGTLYSVTDQSLWWSSSPSDNISWYRGLSNSRAATVLRAAQSHEYGLSVRCLQVQ